MTNNLEQLIDVVKQQAELFLLDAFEFYPFGSYISLENEIVPVGVSLENDFPTSAEVISSLEKYFSGIDYKAAIIAIDTKVNKGGELFDALQIRLMSRDSDIKTLYFKYLINDQQVQFAPITL